MDTVYIIGIVVIGIVILGVVYLVSGSNTKGEIRYSNGKRKIAAGIHAEEPHREASASKSLDSGPGINISDNWMIGANILRIARDRVRVIRNRWLGKNKTIINAKTAPTEGSQREK